MRLSSGKTFAVVFIAGSLLGGTVTAFASSILGSRIFADVPSGSYFDQAVGEMYGDGVIKGNPDGTFNPSGYVTRADVAVMLQRFKASLEGNVVISSSSRSSSSSSSSSTSSSSSSSSSQASTASVATNPHGIFRFTSSTFTVNKNGSSVTINVVRTGGNEGSTSVDYSVGTGSAIAGQDYTAVSGTLTFANKETSKSFKLTILNNSANTGTRTAVVTLKNAINGATIASPGTANINIVDPNASSSSTSSSSSAASSNPNGTLSFGAPTYGVLESVGTMTVTVNRLGGSAGAVSVNYATANGSATSGTNYSGVNGTLSFAAGETSKSFTVGIISSSNVDGAKTFTIALSNVTGGASTLTSTATVMILDKDSTTSFGSGSFKVLKSSYDVSESEKQVTITVQRVGGSLGTINVDYATVNGSAYSGNDFTNTSGTLTFAPGETSKVIVIPIAKHTIPADNRYFYLNLSNPSSGTQLSSPNSATINIFA